MLTPAQVESLERATESAQEFFAGRVIWNVNSTARGGGVAELLRSLVAYARGSGVDARWVVIEGEPAFFDTTKKLHNHLHGSPGSGDPLGEEDRRVYEAVAGRSAAEMAELIAEGDIVLLHDPQTAGMVAPLLRAGAHVVWRCHVGLDLPNDVARQAWRFLLPYVGEAEAYVFSREAFVWEGLDERRIAVIPPSIDAFSPKNQQLERGAVESILAVAGLADGGPDDPPVFVREDGTPGRVDRPAELVEDAPLPRGARVLCQVSRWDRLKDPLGVMRAFAEHVAPRSDSHLVLAGPSVAAVADDPEGREVLAEVVAHRSELPGEVRARIHLASLPMEDAEENAAIVNALQRRCQVICQKSLAEGFGLTVAEAMWKARPVVGTRVGGIQDQIEDGVTGALVDPRDLAGFGDAVVGLLEDERAAAEMGERARLRVRDHFLGPRHLEQYVDLLAAVTAREPLPELG